jgi:hypothetical protein
MKRGVLHGISWRVIAILCMAALPAAAQEGNDRGRAGFPGVPLVEEQYRPGETYDSLQAGWDAYLEAEASRRAAIGRQLMAQDRILFFNTWASPYYGKVRQPIGRVKIWTSPNSSISKPIYASPAFVPDLPKHVGPQTAPAAPVPLPPLPHPPGESRSPSTVRPASPVPQAVPQAPPGPRAEPSPEARQPQEL